jgi:hypothetical protein
MQAFRVFGTVAGLGLFPDELLLAASASFSFRLVKKASFGKLLFDALACGQLYVVENVAFGVASSGGIAAEAFAGPEHTSTAAADRLETVPRLISLRSSSDGRTAASEETGGDAALGAAIRSCCLRSNPTKAEELGCRGLFGGRFFTGSHPPASKTGFFFLACSLFSSSLVLMACSCCCDFLHLPVIFYFIDLLKKSQKIMPIK